MIKHLAGNCINKVNIINGIIDHINLKENINEGRLSNATLYVGYEQYRALMYINKGDIAEVRHNNFQGYSIIRVIEESHCKLLKG